MSWLRAVGFAVIPVLAIGAYGCGGSSSSSNTSPTTPSAPTYTDVFTGTLAAGATDYGSNNQNHFTIHQVGSLTATITKLSPLSTITVGLGLGVYDTSTQTCSLQLFADAAKLNIALSATVQATGELCVGLYDVGNITDSTDYEVSITHT